MLMHTKMLIRALSVSQHSSFVVIRRHPPFIPPSKGGQYILAFGKQTVHLRPLCPCNKSPLRHGYLRWNEYMRLPPRGGSAIGGGGECVCEIRNGAASSYSFLPRSPSVTLRAPPALRNATNEKPPLGCFSKSCMPSQREARIPQPLGKQTVHLRPLFCGRFVNRPYGLPQDRRIWPSSKMGSPFG